MESFGVNDIENIDELIQLLNGTFLSITNLKNTPKIKIEGNFKKEELLNLVTYFSVYISHYMSNDISNSELYISKNKKTGEIFIHENKVENLVKSEKQTIYSLIEEGNTRDYINYLKEETAYLINVKDEIIKLIGTIEYDKDLDFGGIDINVINYIDEFITNYDLNNEENRFIKRFLNLFEEIKNNHNTTLNIYENEVLELYKNYKYFYRDMKTEIYNFINKMIEENTKLKDDLK